MAEEIINKVAQSGVEQIDLEKWLPKSFMSFDIAPFLWQGMVIKEKDFRAALKVHGWAQYTDQHVAIFCSADAIIQPWVYMLIASEISKAGGHPYFGDIEEARFNFLTQKINTLDLDFYRDARVVIKGCSKVKNIEALLMQFVSKIQPVAKSVMFGEICSTVPIYKQPRQKR